MARSSMYPPTFPQLSTTETKPVDDVDVKLLPPYNVIIYNDDHHSMQFVMEVLCKVIGCNLERSFLLMMEAHTSGRAVVWTGSKEVAELKLDQIRSCHELRDDGRDLGPLRASIEPAPG